MMFMIMSKSVWEVKGDENLHGSTVSIPSSVILNNDKMSLYSEYQGNFGMDNIWYAM
jgi:hypothetical protein